MDERMNDTQAAEFWKRRLIEYVTMTNRGTDKADGDTYVMKVESALRRGDYDDELVYY